MVPRELYTLGAVRFDTQPLAKLQGELMAKKAAKEEALDKWIFDLQGKIPSGQVRAIDREPFQQKVAQWIKEGIAAKGKPGAQQSILEGFQGLLADANESKAAGERQQKIAEIRLQNPDKVDEEDLPIIDRMSKSIYDPLFYKKPEIRQPFTLEDFSANIPTWDVGKRKQFIDFAISGVKPVGKINEKSTYDPTAMQTVTTYDEVFTPKQIQDVTQKAIAILSDRSGLKTYKNILKEGEQQVPSDQFISLAKAYELVKPGDVMNTPLKAAQAEIALNMIGAKETKRLTTPNVSGRIVASRAGGGGVGGGQIQVTGNAFDEITNIKGIKKGVDVQDGIALLNSKPYNGKVVVLGEELPLSVVAPLKSAGLKIAQKDKVDVVFENGKVISIKPIGKSAVSKTMMENAQLKYSTEPQKGPQMIFGRPSGGGGGAYLGVDENGNPIFED